jgi:predicted DNA binding protein
MWVMKLKAIHKNCLLTPKAVEFKVTDYVYLISAYKKNKKFYYVEIHILEGKEENKELFLKALKKEKTIIKVEKEGNLVITLNEEPITKQYYEPFFDKTYIQNKPIIVSPEGYEIWELISWDKEMLTQFLKKFPKEFFDIEMQSIKRISLKEVYIPKIAPELTSKQKESLLLAVKNGFYEYPKKIELQELAILMKLSRQTYQEHLHKAEKKILDLFV